MNRVNDLDTIELASAWTYVDDLEKDNKLIVNENRYKVIKKYSKSSLDYNVYERYEGENPTGDIVLAFEGTDPEDIQGDVFTDLKLAGYNSPSQLEHARTEYNNLKEKYTDANNLSKSDFKIKYDDDINLYKNKQIKVVTGNSLGGANAQYVGLIDPNVQVVTTNTAPLPMSIAMNSRKNVKNIRNYHSEFDVLTQVNKGGFMYYTIKGKHIYLSNGLPTFNALVNSHTGYNIVEDESDVSKSEEKKLNNMPIYKSKNGLKIYADMDEHTPIFVWSGDALGAGAPHIKLDKSNLGELESYVHGRLTNYVEQINKKMKDVQQSVEEDHDKFHEYVERLKDEFKEITHFKKVESLIEYCSDSIKRMINRNVDLLCSDLNRLKFEKHISHFPGAAGIIDEVINILTDIEDKFAEIIHNGEQLVTGLLDICNNTIFKMFISPTLGFSDGVREELLAHFEIVIPNIEMVKKQVENYGDGIQDILSQMSHIDDNVMVNQVAINHSATKQTL